MPYYNAIHIDPEMIGEVAVKTIQLPLSNQRHEIEITKRRYYYEINSCLLWEANGTIDKTKGYISFGGVRFLITDYHFVRDTHLCVLANPLGYITYFVYRATRRLDDIYRRIIITLYVWGLATKNTTPYYELPSWRDIKLVKWLGRLL